MRLPLLLLLPLIPVALAAQPAPQCPGRITVPGDGAAEAAPDLLRLTFRAEAEAPGPAEALAAASARAAGMLAALRAQGIADDDLATVDVSLFEAPQRPERDRPADPPAWRAATGVAATLRDIEAFGAVAEAATEGGATGLSGVEFDVSDRGALLTQARAAAVRDALSRARGMAEAAGLTLGAVQEIAEGGGRGPAPFEARAMAMSDAGMPLAPGRRTLTASVSLTAALCP